MTRPSTAVLIHCFRFGRGIPFARLYTQRMNPAHRKRKDAAKKGGVTATTWRVARNDAPHRTQTAAQAGGVRIAESHCLRWKRVSVSGCSHVRWPTHGTP